MIILMVYVSQLFASRRNYYYYHYIYYHHHYYYYSLMLRIILLFALSFCVVHCEHNFFCRVFFLSFTIAHCEHVLLFYIFSCRFDSHWVTIVFSVVVSFWLNVILYFHCVYYYYYCFNFTNKPLQWIWWSVSCLPFITVTFIPR